MDIVDNGIPGKYNELNGAGELKMDLPLRKSSKSKEEKPLKRRCPSPVHPKCGENAIHHFQSFAENASIDGIKFVGEKGRTIPERIFWAITLLVALVLCIILVVQTFKKWLNSPVIVTFSSSQKTVFQVPFPGITLCVEQKSQKGFFNYTDVYLKKANNETMDDFDELGFNYMSVICDSPSELLNNDAKLTDSAIIDFFMLAAPDFDESIMDINWRGKKFHNNGTGLFSTVLTSDGVCYTFNAFDRTELFTDAVSYQERFFSTNGLYSEWSPETGYSKNAGIDSYPRRTLIAGEKGGLNLVLNAFESELDYACTGGIQGFKVTLHHPGELPRVKQNFFRIPLDQTVVAAIKPKMITTSEDLRSYSPKDRQCYFVSEKKLKFFKIYNQQNCLIECLANFTLKNCECVNFHMPREELTPICGAASIECMENSKILFLANEVNYKIKQNRKSKLTRKDLNLDDMDYTDRCDCLPSCTSLDYDVEISQADWNWRETYQILRQTNDWDKELDRALENNSLHLTQLSIFFKEMQFITLERNELYGLTDFWANIGGIIGLFTGFSFITMFEILYYLTLRLSCNIRMFGQRYWSGAPELLEEAKTMPDRNKNI